QPIVGIVDIEIDVGLAGAFDPDFDFVAGLEGELKVFALAFGQAERAGVAATAPDNQDNHPDYQKYGNHNARHDAGLGPRAQTAPAAVRLFIRIVVNFGTVVLITRVAANQVYFCSAHEIMCRAVAGRVP